MLRTLLVMLFLGAVSLSCGSAKKACDATNCTGCCDTTGGCQSGATVLQCGHGGSLCHACPAGNLCSFAGLCTFTGVGGGSGGGSAGGTGGGGSVSCQASCAGCCSVNGTCQSGNVTNTCGLGGATCAACTGSQTCAGGVCRDSSCNGCVQNGTCVTNVSNTACGTLGLSCFDCTTNGGTCNTATGTCTGGTCAGCRDSLGHCTAGDSKGACGNLGVQCVACTGTQACVNGACTTTGTGGGSGTGGGTATGGGTGTGGGGTCTDNDQDGVLSCNGDCDDNNPNVGPNAFEVPGNGIDDNCNGQIDEAPVGCDASLGNAATDYAKALGLCAWVTNASFVTTNTALGHALLSKFGDQFTPREGAVMAMLSSGKATDQYNDAGYEPQDGTDFNAQAPYPLWLAPKCGTPANPGHANDLQELDVTMTVPQNAHGFTVDFSFFTVEYPEYACSQFADRFYLLSNSQANTPANFPSGFCVNGRCDVAYDSNSDTFSASNSLLNICDAPASSLGLTNHCTRSVSLLAKTGYSDLVATTSSGGISLGNISAGGSTGWRRVTAPAKPGETLTLQFIVLDESDGIFDTSVLLDHFNWTTATTTSGTTTDLQAP